MPSYRETVTLLWRGTPMAAILLLTAGFNEGSAISAERNDLPVALPVGTRIRCTPSASATACAIARRTG